MAEQRIDLTVGRASRGSTGGTRIQIVEGDITEQDTDAVVNAANSSLMGGGGRRRRDPQGRRTRDT